jgi:hypothetical protein
MNEVREFWLITNDPDKEIAEGLIYKKLGHPALLAISTKVVDARDYESLQRKLAKAVEQRNAAEWSWVRCNYQNDHNDEFMKGQLKAIIQHLDAELEEVK